MPGLGLPCAIQAARSCRQYGLIERIKLAPFPNALDRHRRQAIIADLAQMLCIYLMVFCNGMIVEVRTLGAGKNPHRSALRAFPMNSVEPHDGFQFTAADYVAVDHVDDLQFTLVQLVGAGGTAILNEDNVKAFVGKTPHGR